MVCISGMTALFLIPEKVNTLPTSSTPKQDEPTITPNVEDIILQETEDAGQKYIDKIYFAGESTTAHIFKGGIERSHILVPSSGTCKLSPEITQITVGETGLTIPEAVQSAGAEIVILNYGINNSANFKEIQFKTYYEKLINAIKDASPDTIIIIQSVYPVTKSYSDSSSITNDILDKINVWAKEVALDNGLPYLDVQSILKDSNNALKQEYAAEDGYHLNEDAYSEIIKYIRTHSIYQ